MSETPASPSPSPVATGAPATNIIERIKKFLALSKSDNVNEAMAAATHAHKLMLRWKLTQADLEGTAPSSIGEWSVEGDFTPAWRFALLTAVAKSYYCRVIRILDTPPRKRGELAPPARWEGRVIGKREDSEGISYIFTFFQAEISRLCSEAQYDLTDNHGHGESNEEDSFKRGAVYALQRKLIEQKRSFDVSSEKALVLARRSDADVKRFMDTQYKQRERDVELGAAKDYEAFHAGYKAGMKLNVPGTETAGHLPEKKQS
jgi:hypothetical protein